MLGVHEMQLRAWERQDLIPVSEVYSFTELRALRTLVDLRRSGLRAERIRATIDATKERLMVRDPLTEAKLFLQGGKRIGVRAEGLVLDPFSGQYLLDFESALVQSLPPRSPHLVEAERKQRRGEAERWFQQGLQAEQAGQSDRRIEECYRECLKIDPTFSSALVNLGTLHFNRGRHAEAEQCYKQAVENDPRYALAHFNLANLHDERGEVDQALTHYLKALEFNPDYGDAHYNIALLYQGRTEYLQALTHWKKYLKLDPGSSWAAIAKREMTRIRDITVLPGSRD
jgi:tetratricopeptide (TPR) repeat protein